MRSRLLRRLLLAATLVALLPVPIARAADIQPTVTMWPIAATAYRGDHESLVAEVSDSAPGTVTFEWSSDGASWQTYSGAEHLVNDQNQWVYQDTVPSTAPLGAGFIRAHVEATPGFLSADSAAQARETKIHQGQILTYGSNPIQSSILPSTSVSIYGSGTAPTSLERWTGSAWQHLDGPTGGSHSTQVGVLGEGDHKFRVHIDTTDLYLGADQELTVSVSKGSSQPTWNGALTVEAGKSLPAGVGVAVDVQGPSEDAQMSVKDVAGDTIIATGNVGMTFTISPMAVGTHQFEVSYAGNSDYIASTKTFDVIVTDAVVDANLVGISYTTFYPYKDGYRDALPIHGNRLEPLSVSIRIYSPTNHVVKGVTLPSADGSYTYLWNGRNSSGTMLAAGKYKVVQVLTDAGGAHMVVTSYVNLSAKRLVTKTSYITKLGSSISAAGDAGTGSIAISKTSGYSKLYARYPDGWVGVGYQFTLPSATIYKAIAFQVYEKGAPSSPGTFIGIGNFHTCIYSSTNWNEACFDHWRAIGHSPLTTMWFSTSGSATDNRYLRTVRRTVSAYSGTHTIYKARVKVTYQVLQ
jgi:FlgD Ig-like domain